MGKNKVVFTIIRMFACLWQKNIPGLQVSLILGLGLVVLPWQIPLLTMAQTRLVQHTDADRLLQQGNTYYQQGQFRDALQAWTAALEQYRQRSDRAGERNALNNLGIAYEALGQYERAIELHGQNLAIAREVGDRTGESRALGNLGVAYTSIGQPGRAIEFHQHHLSLAREMGDRAEESRALNNLGVAYEALGQYTQAIPFYEQTLVIARDLNDRAGEGRALNNLGVVYEALGQYERSIELHQQNLAIVRELGDRAGEGRALNNLGIAYFSLGEYRRAIEFYQQTLTLAQTSGFKAAEVAALTNLGNAHTFLEEYEEAIAFHKQNLTLVRAIGDRTGEANALGNLGTAYGFLGQYEQAIELYQDYLVIAEEIRDRAGEGIILGNLGAAYAFLNQDDAALEAYEQSLTIAQEIGDRATAGRILDNLGLLLANRDQTELAITFYKQSVNVRESIRQDIRGLDLTLQQSYTNTVADTYRRLADLLLQQGRVMEALDVLDLLKVQELREYFETLNREELANQTIRFLEPEQQFWNLYSPQGTSLRFDTQLFNTQLSADLARLSAEEINTIPNTLRQIPTNAALLYPLVLDDRLELILFIPGQSPQRYTVEVPRQRLAAIINLFREDLQDPRSSRVQRPAQQLYQWLIEPIATDLARANITTLYYAPDRQLRYIPLAALYDGTTWLVEQYQVNYLIAYNLTNVDSNSQPERSRELKVLAAAFGETPQGGLPGLPYSIPEVQEIAATLPNTSTLLHKNFNRQTLENQIQDHSILHLATHAEFRSGTPEESYILLGDGDRITLPEVKTWPLSQVDLVVLSACQTGLGSLGDGREILGFGYQVQLARARGAIASLWSVDDGGTSLLMQQFYAQLVQGVQAQDNAMSQAEALRQAQLVMVRNVGIETDFPSDTRHPYYWAPFILISNELLPFYQAKSLAK